MGDRLLCTGKHLSGKGSDYQSATRPFLRICPNSEIFLRFRLGCSGKSLSSVTSEYDERSTP
jgi:hypothetical protein